MPGVWADLSGKLFGFHGRLNRLDWWIFSAGLLVRGFVLYQLLGLFGIYSVLEWMNPTGELDSQWENGVIWLIIGVLLLWPNLAISVKRAHDIGASGWVAVTVICVAQFGDLLLSQLGLDDSLGWIAEWLFLGSNLVLIILFGGLKSQWGPNRFGHSPNGGGVPEISATEEIS